MLERFSELSGRPCIHTALFHSNHKPEAYKHALKHLEDANERGYRVFALGGIVRIGSLFTLIEYNLFDDMPAWNRALACSLDQRLVTLPHPRLRVERPPHADNNLVPSCSGRG